MAETQMAERRSTVPDAPTVLVLRAYGTIGSAPVRLLGAGETPVHAVSRSLRRIPGASPRVEFSVGDLARPDTLPALSMDEEAAVTGRPLRYRPLAPEDAGQFLHARLPASQAGFLLVHYAAVRAGDFDSVTADVAKLTGRPAGSWRTFLADNHGLL